MDNSPEIPIEDAMTQAFRRGTLAYKPKFCDRVMRLEIGAVEASLANLRELIKSGLTVREILIGPHGNALIRFDDGHSYLATGFSVGRESTPTKGLAEFCAEAGLGSHENIYAYLVALPADYEDILDLPVAEDELEPGELRIAE